MSERLQILFNELQEEIAYRNKAIENEDWWSITEDCVQYVGILLDTFNDEWYIEREGL